MFKKKLLKAGIIQPGIFNQRRRGSILQGHRLQIGGAGAGDPHALLPVFGMLVPDHGKVSVFDEISFHGPVRLPGASTRTSATSSSASAAPMTRTGFLFPFIRVPQNVLD